MHRNAIYRGTWIIAALCLSLTAGCDKKVREATKKGIQNAAGRCPKEADLDRFCAIHQKANQEWSGGPYRVPSAFEGFGELCNAEVIKYNSASAAAPPTTRAGLFDNFVESLRPGWRCPAYATFWDRVSLNQFPEDLCEAARKLTAREKHGIDSDGELFAFNFVPRHYLQVELCRDLVLELARLDSGPARLQHLEGMLKRDGREPLTCPELVPFFERLEFGPVLSRPLTEHPGCPAGHPLKTTNEAEGTTFLFCDGARAENPTLRRDAEGRTISQWTRRWDGRLEEAHFSWGDVGWTLTGYAVSRGEGKLDRFGFRFGSMIAAPSNATVKLDHVNLR